MFGLPAPTRRRHPGVTRWPAPGESVLSPAAQEALAAPGSWSSWNPGTVVGTIGPEGLTGPTEAFAYVNPPPTAELLDASWSSGRSFGGGVRASQGDITSFGANGVAGLGDLSSLYEWPLFVLLYVPTVVVPAVFLLAGVWLAGGKQRRRAERTLALLGATALQRATMRVTAVARPWALGTIVAAAATASACGWDVTIPFVDYTLLAVDVRRWSLPLAGVWLASSVACLALLQTQSPSRSLIRKGRRDAPGTAQTIAGIVCLVGVVGSIPLINTAALSPQTSAYLTMATFIVVVLTMPALCTLTIGWVTSIIGARGGLGTLVGVGLLRQGRAPVAALAGTVGASLCMLSVVNVFVSTLSDPFPEARPVYAASVGHVVTVGSGQLDLQLVTPQRWRVLTKGSDQVLLAVGREHDGEISWRLFTSSPDLQGKDDDGRCRFDSAAPTALRNTVADLDNRDCPGPIEARPGKAALWNLSLYSSEGQLDASAFAATVSAWVSPPPAVDIPGSAYVGTGPLASATQLRWIPFCAAIGLVLVVIALLQFAAGDLRLAQRRITGYLILGAPESLARQAMTLRLALPVAIAIAYATVFSLQRPLVSTAKDATYSIEPFVIYSLVVVVGIVVAIAANVRGARVALTRWRPGRNRE